MVFINKLIKKAQKGNKKAFSELFEQIEEELYRIIYLYVKNENDALDVVQEVAYLSFKGITKLENPQYFKTWIIKIAINKAIDCIRKNKKIVHLHPEYEEFIGSYDLEDVALNVSLQELLNKLNEEEKGIVIFKYYYDYTFKEISEELEIPIGTVKSVLYRSLEKLRKYSKEEASNYE